MRTIINILLFLAITIACPIGANAAYQTVRGIEVEDVGNTRRAKIFTNSPLSNSYVAGGMTGTSTPPNGCLRTHDVYGKKTVGIDVQTLAGSATVTIKLVGKIADNYHEIITIEYGTTTSELIYIVEYIEELQVLGKVSPGWATNKVSVAFVGYKQ